jgi:hypothetical protein
VTAASTTNPSPKVVPAKGTKMSKTACVVVLSRVFEVGYCTGSFAP